MEDPLDPRSSWVFHWQTIATIPITKVAHMELCVLE